MRPWKHLKKWWALFFIPFFLYLNKWPQFDRYLEILPKKPAAGKVSTAHSDKLVEYGDDRLQQLFLQRRMKERQAPTDAQEELRRYLSDPILAKDECPDVLEWWKVLMFSRLEFCNDLPFSITIAAILFLVLWLLTTLLSRVLPFQASVNSQVRGW